MLNYTSEDKVFDTLALIKVTNKTQLRIGDKVKIAYSGWDIQTEFDTNEGFRKVTSKKKVECIVDAVIVKEYNGIAIQMIGKEIEAYTSGKLKNFKKGFDGQPGVGASWGGTGTGSGAFLSNGCKIIGRYA